MRNSSHISLLLFLFLSARAQTNFAWFPARPGIQYNYKIDTSAGPISDVIKIDSVVSQTYYLNTIVTNCDTCHNSHLLNDPFDSTYVLNHQPQFLSRAFVKTGNAIWLKGSRSFVLYPFSAVGSSWLFDTAQAISATLIAKSLQMVLGSSDSVCIIKLTGNDTIILSKNTGIVKFPFKTSLHHSYNLVGTEGTTNAGVKQKRFHDFFDFQAGDVFQYEFTDNDYNLFPPKFQAGRERWDILSATLYSDSVKYLVRKTHLDSLKYGNSTALITAFTNTYTVVFTDSITHPANGYPLQQILANPYFVFNNGIPHIHKLMVGTNGQRITKTFGQACPDLYLTAGITGAASETPFANVFLNRNSSKIIGRQLTENLGFTSELYNDYDRIYQKCLVGSIKNGDTSGVVYNDVALGIKTNRLAANYFMYPVPANEQLTISGDLKAITQITIVNSFGVPVLSLMPTHSINTAVLSNGLYFIVISDQHFSETRKLVIQH